MKENEQIIDVNVISHSFKSHIDYVVLLRKLCLYYEKRLERDNKTESVLPTQRSIDDHSNNVELKILIESAMRIRNPTNDIEPPNAFVKLRSPFQGSIPEEIFTNTVSKSSYPAWHSSNNLIFPFTE
jgi:hypothetical protein